MRKLASVQRVKTISPIDGADAIVKISVLGWDLVSKKGEFNVGDLCVYFEIDSFLPISREFEFLRSSSYKFHPTLGEGFRLKTIRLRGQVSQGLALPLKNFGFKELDHVEGQDVTSELGVRKYEEPEVFDTASGIQLREFPFFVPKTEEPRIQSEPSLLERLRNQKYYITEKLDGASITVFSKGEKVGICSRNQELLYPEDLQNWSGSENDLTKNVYVDAVCRSGLFEALKQLRRSNGNLALQGELVGPRIQGNYYNLKEPTIYFFGAYLIDESRYVDYRELQSMCRSFDLKMVPLIEEVHSEDLSSVESVIEFATGYSLVVPKKLREGVVLRTQDNRGHERISFKAISNKYLLKQK